MTSRHRAVLLLVPVLCPLLLVGCSSGSSKGTDPDVAASAPVPGVTLPPDELAASVPQPDEVPAGMVPVLSGSGPRAVDVVAGYSGTGATAATAAAKLKAHGFVKAYVAQYAHPTTGDVLSIVVSQFATAAGAAQDFADDQAAKQGTPIPAEGIGDSSSATVQDIPGSVVSQLVLLRFRRGPLTWSLAYKAAQKADPSLPIGLARTLLARTAT